MGERLKRIVQSSSDKHLKIKLVDILESNDPKSRVAFEIKYHLACLTNAERSSDKLEPLPFSGLPEMISNIEFIEIVNSYLGNPV